MEELIIEVLVGLVIYLIGTEAGDRLLPGAATIGRHAVALIVLPWWPRPFSWRRGPRTTFVAVILGYLAFAALAAGKPGSLNRQRLERWFGPDGEAQMNRSSLCKY